MKLLATCVTAGLFYAASVSAQDGQVAVRHTPEGYTIQKYDRFGSIESKVGSVPRILQNFIETSTASRGLTQIIGVVTYRDRFPTATVDSILDGLERIATTHRDDNVARRAIALVGSFGSSPDANRSYTPRLARIYRNVGRVRRLAVLDAAGQLAQAAPAAAFLRTIAMEEPGSSNRQLPDAAVFSLSLLGDEGSRTLRDLHERRLVRDEEAWRLLVGLSQKGYRSSSRRP